jgi:ParB-like nuclease domain
VSNSVPPPFNWRNHLAVHPAADLFPLLSEAELKELADDIKKNGLQSPIVLCRSEDDKRYLLDGRNRLDALAVLGWLSPPRPRMPCERVEMYNFRLRFYPFEINEEALSGGLVTNKTALQYCGWVGDDLYSVILSLNVHRRHLTREQKRELIAKVLKANPDKSNRHIASITKSDHKTVGKVRAEKEGRGEIPHVKARTDTKGRKQSASRKPKATVKEVESPPKFVNVTVHDNVEASAEEQTAEPRFSGDKEKLEHFRSAMLIHADSAFDLSKMLLASYLDCPSALTSETVEAVRCTAEAWSVLAATLEEKKRGVAA